MMIQLCNYTWQLYLVGAGSLYCVYCGRREFVFTVYFEYIISQLEINNDGWIRYEQGEAYLGLLQKQIKTDAL